MVAMSASEVEGRRLHDCWLTASARRKNGLEKSYFFLYLNRVHDHWASRFAGLYRLTGWRQRSRIVVPFRAFLQLLAVYDDNEL